MPGTFLLSKHVAEDLEEYEQWRPLLHDLGECEVKHGVRVSVVNLYDDASSAIRSCRKSSKRAAQKRRAALRWAAMTAVLLVLAAIVAVFSFVIAEPPARSTLAVRRKRASRCLPFENLSRRQRQRLLCRRHSGRNSDALIQDRRSEGDLAHIHAALQKRAGKPA